MKPVREKKVVQIEITNACVNQCSNCSRFVGHHRAPYFMEFKVVERAIDSLLDFPGGVGIMGGEPTLHPRFVEICALVRKMLPPDRRFLWTSGHNWGKYRGVIRKTFGSNVIYNDHRDVTQKHHPMLLSISDVIDDPASVARLLARCWVDQRWSAAINPKGCFFCEIAAAMDVLFDGPGGLLIERGWWKKDPAAFQDQQDRYCLHCGASVPYAPATLAEGHDVVSETNYRKLLHVESPKAKKGKVQVVSEKLSPGAVKSAEEWEPWNHLGVMKEEGTGKGDAALYGRFHGWLYQTRKELIEKSKVLRKVDFVVLRVLWRLGVW
ncbi:radical SAM protein [Geomesophilobacter sediminis]|uniref:Radical SAM protein n=1 Tax=Geomesophilobacter sediminis TaxID=2798584 RepID=A0A8J7SD20_9BACT|nr:radical SAM protein [Geomesophilobacter sediminis]MBJ6727559.1 radical SAM protein [Geomesophilobacter sediminis]